MGGKDPVQGRIGGTMTPSDDAKKRPGQSGAGAEAEAARKARQAEQLRANLAKRKAQQRKRDTPPSGKEGA
tara:strand:+ start:1214 stop:1426 length:213 start_codon:yes stop_codon:yes gene_type:complete